MEINAREPGGVGGTDRSELTVILHNSSDSRYHAHMRRRALLGTLLVFISLTAAVHRSADASLSDDPFDLSSMAFRVFRDTQGLPQNTVHSIALDSRGRLWVGTQDGAAYFDGRHWNTIDMPSRLQSNFIRALLGASDGSMWFGTRAGGLFRLHNGQWYEAKGMCARAGCPRINVLEETFSASGAPIIWAGTYGGGLGRFEDGKWTILTTEHGLPSNRIWGLMAEKDETGTTLWVGTESGLAVLRPDSEHFSVDSGFPTGSVNSIVRTPPDKDSRGALWVGTYGDGLARLKDGRPWYSVTTKNGLPSNFITSLVLGTSIGGGSSLWAGTDGGGLIRISHTKIETTSTRNGLPCNAVYSLLETDPSDAPAMLWVGSRNGGLAQFIEGSWKHLVPGNTHQVAPVTALLETRASGGPKEFWLGTDGEGLYRFSEGKWTHFTDRLPSQTVQCLGKGRTADNRPVLWVGTRNGGLLRYLQGRWTLFAEETGDLPSNMVQAVLESRSEDGSTVLWVGTRHGLARFSDGHWTHIDSVEGQPLGSVLSLLETMTPEGDSKIWIGSTSGLASYSDGHWRSLNEAAKLVNTAVQCLFERSDSHGRRCLWVGTDGGGVTVLNQDDNDLPLFTLTDTSDPELPSPVVSGITEDLEGQIYLLTNAGVARLTEISSGADDPSRFLLKTFTTEDGLPLNEGKKGATLVDEAGRIWVGTVGGAAVLEPSIERPDRHADQLLLEALLATAQGRTPMLGATLEYRNRHIVFEYALLSYFKESQTRFRTQLIGLDDQPTPWTTENHKEYQTLKDGAYTFRVWGRDFAGNISGPVDFPFEVKPAPWESWWAILLMFLALIFAVRLAYQARIRALKARERRLSILVDSRTEELAAANEALVDLSYTDPLTGIGNRRRFDQVLEIEWRRAIRSEQSIALILVDIDNLKKINDEHGHPEGDDCLKAAARTISENLSRSGDSVARIGGDEFAVTLPGTDLEGALLVADLLRLAIGNLEDRIGPAAAKPRIEVSCGVGAICPTSTTDPRGLLKAADTGLYKAKSEGRNRVAAG